MAYPTTQNYNFIDEKAGMQNLYVTSDVQQHPVGYRAKAWSATYGFGEFIYLKGLALTVAGETVIFDTYAGTTKRGVANDRGPCAVAMSANVANQWGWYQIHGAAVVKVAAAFAAGAIANWTATAGTIDDAKVATDAIDGFVSKTAIDTPSVGFAMCQLAYPCANGSTTP